MVICKYYLQGTCRYGDNCRFEHTQPGYNANINSALHQQQQPRNPPQYGPPSDIHELCKTVRSDLQAAERGGQWMLSCYCPLPSKAILLPGLEDHSPDELRCLMYQAQSVGSVEPCKQHIQKLNQNAVAMRTAFKTPTRESMAILEKIRTAPVTQGNPFQSSTPSAGGGSGGSIFGGSAQAQPQMSVFGGGTSQPPMYGATAPHANPFGGGSASQPSIFGGASAAPANPFGGGSASQPSIFGGASSTPVNPFGGATTQTTPFGSPPPSVGVGAQSPMFGSTPFGTSAQPSVFGGGATTSVFGGETAPAPSAINSFSFAAAAESSQVTAQNQGIFGSSAAPQNSVFMMANTPQPTGGSIFGGSAQPAAGVFAGSSQPSTQTQPSTTSIFGGSAAPSSAGVTNVNPFGTPSAQSAPLTVSNDSVAVAHTPISELTEEEKAQFLAPTFSAGQIPLRPPPKELCA